MKNEFIIKKTKGGKKMKRLVIFGLMSLMTILMIGVVKAANTCDFDQTQTSEGTSNTYIRGSIQNVSATITGGATTGDNVTQCNISISSGTITGAIAYNVSTNSSYCNTTVNTYQLKDDTTYTFTMTLYNETSDSLGTCTETYISDNTIPVCTHSQSSRTTYKPDSTWTVTGTNASSSTLQFGSNTAYTMNEVSDTFTYTTKQGTLAEGTYSSITAATSDGLNYTSCILEYVKISSKDKLVQVAVASSGQKGEQVTVSNAGNTTNKTLMIVLVIGIAVYLYINKKK